MVAELDLPESFRARILASGRGDRGERARWLRDLPEVVATLAERWELRLGELLPSSCNYVVAAERESGQACVLKVGPPLADGEGAARAGLALRLAGPSAVRVLEEDDAAGALLLERASGGPLSAMCERDDDGASEILASAMKGFWVPVTPDCGLPPLSTLEDTFEEFARGPHGASFRGRDLMATLGEIDTGVRDLRAASATARRVLEELLAERAAAVVLHGDLHQGNVLEDEHKGWVVVDAKGYVGDAGYDTGAMLYNPMPFPAQLGDVEAVVHRRLDIMANITRIDREPMAAWGYVKTVLSLLWSLEAGEVSRHDGRMQVMAALRKMI